MKQFTASFRYVCRRPIKEWAGATDKGWDKMLLEFLRKLSLNSTIDIRCYETGCNVQSFQSLDQFQHLIDKFQEKSIQKGVPLKVITARIV